MQSQKRIGVIGIPDGWSSEKLADAVEQKTGSRFFISIKDVSADLSTGAVYHDGLDLRTLDALIIKKMGVRYSPLLLDRLEVLRFLQQQGVRIFSDPLAIMRVLNRLTCTLTLRAGSIPMPDTVITEQPAVAHEAVKRFGRAVLKPFYTTKARGMEVIEDDQDALDKILAFQDAGNPILYVQKMIEFNGKDLGVVFLGGSYIATYARVAHHDSWNTTTHSGGKYEKCEPDQAVIDIAYRAQSLFNLDFTCVDIAITPHGPMVFEVSAFGGFRGLYESGGIQVADILVDYIIKELNHA